MSLYRILLSIGLSLFIPAASLFAVAEGSRINMGVSPIRHDFTISPGQTITKEVSFYNNSDVPYNIYLTAEDCVTDDGAGTPKCRLNPRSGADPESISSWIRYDGADRFIVPPRTEKKMNLIITAPTDAIPGGHYGAIFFNNPDSGTVDGNTVKMVKRTGILLLANVPGQIVYDTEFGDIGIDLSAAPSTPSDWFSRMKRELDPRLTPPVLVESDFGMLFSVPVANKGNTHILPVGRIELYDEGAMLEKIGKESIKSEEGVILGEKIVDYLPINDEAGNVLPSSNRVYTVLWKGFAYEEIENGKQVIKFLSPSEYYSKKNSNSSYLLPWEKMKVIDASKVIKAEIHLEYKKTDGTIESHDSEQDVLVRYSYIDKGINWGALILMLLLVFLVWLFWLLFRREKEKEEELEDEVHVLEHEVEDLEEELDELEKGRRLAKAALAKKKKAKASKALDKSEKKVVAIRAAKAVKPVVAKKPVKAPIKKTTSTKKTPPKKA